MSDKLSDLNKFRSSEYLKNEKDENFLKDLNSYLIEFEQSRYKDDLVIEHPLLFTYGLPRSGTTLMSQLMAYGFEIGYINNFIARFWNVPVTGIRFSKALFKNTAISYESNYASTKNLTDIHEFGYFWRKYLKKESFDDIENYKQNEKLIDWDFLYKLIANIQNEFGMGWAAKNILGSYHVEKLTEVFEKVLFIYIERDMLDSAISILDARKKYYSDNLTKWWSYAPPEINKIKNLPYLEQIAGQVYYLKEFYEDQFTKNKNIIKINYIDLCKNPKEILLTVKEKCKELYNYDLKINSASIPEKFNFRQYTNREQEKVIFQDLIDSFKTIQK